MPISETRFAEWSHKVLEQLVALNSDIQNIKQQISNNQTTVNTNLETLENNLTKRIDAVEVLLTGNDSPEKGVIIRLDRLEVDSKVRKWWTRAAITAAFGGIVTALEAYFKK